MKSNMKWTSLAVALLFTAVLSGHASPAQSTPAQVRTTLSHALPPLDGSHLQVTVVEVAYAPGGSSKPHSHPCPVIGYVAEGAIRFQVKGEPETIYKAGESFYEAPNGVHQISANASDKEPAKLVGCVQIFV
jgi:quercetin dioxygenase-like cupin family protein